MKRLVIIFGALLLAATAAAQTTTTVTDTVRDITGSIVPGGQVTFQLQPPGPSTISGIGTFSGQTTVCTINQAAYGIGTGQITSLVRSSNTVTATFVTTQPFIVGDVLTLASWTDTTFNGTFTVTGVTTGASPTVTWSQTASNSSATGGYISALRSTPGPGSCTLTQNTALTPAGTYYKVTVWPGFSPTASFNFYALSNTQDLSAVVPTPGQVPAFSFVDLFSNQTISGNKTFTGSVTISGSLNGTFGGSPTFTGRVAIAPSATGAVPLTLNCPSSNGTDCMDIGVGGINELHFDANGNFTAPSTWTFSGPVIIANGANGLSFTETASALTPASGSDVCAGSSAAHALKCSFNNGPAANVPLSGTLGPSLPACTDANSLLQTTGCNPVVSHSVVDLTAQGANAPTTTIITPSADGTYRFGCYIVVTRAATTSSTLPTCVVVFNDADTNTANTLAVTNTNTANSVGAFGTPNSADGNPMQFRAKGGAAIQYATGSYASSGATSMQYAVHIVLEGPF